MSAPDAHAHHSRDGMLVVLFSFALTLAVVALFQDSPSSGLYSLLVIPVGVTARVFGLKAGLAAGIAAFAVIVLHAQLAGIEFSRPGYTARAVVLLAVAWLAAPRLAPSEGWVSETTSQNGSHQERRLTPRELEVLRLLALGHTNAEIAEMLFLSVRTVESHRARIQRKLMRRGRAELTRYALQNGVIEPSEAPTSEQRGAGSIGHAPGGLDQSQALRGLQTAAYTVSRSQPFRRT